MTEYTTVSLESIGALTHGRGKHKALWDKLVSLAPGQAVQLSGNQADQERIYNALYSKTRGSNRLVRAKRIDASTFAVWLVVRA